MRVELSINKSSNNTLNKELEIVHIIDVNFRGDIDISTPYITISKIPYGDLLQVNYVNIPDLERGYFIESVKQVTGKILRIDLVVDVLSSFKDIVLNSYANVNRAVREGDDFKGELNVSYKNNYERFNSNIELESGKQIFMSTVGAK